MILSRRSILRGLIAAPIVVRAGLIMPVKAAPLMGRDVWDYDPNLDIYRSIALGFTITRQAIMDNLYMYPEPPEKLIGWVDA